MLLARGVAILYTVGLVPMTLIAFVYGVDKHRSRAFSVWIGSLVAANSIGGVGVATGRVVFIVPLAAAVATARTAWSFVGEEERADIDHTVLEVLCAQAVVTFLFCIILCMFSTMDCMREDHEKAVREATVELDELL